MEIRLINKVTCEYTTIKNVNSFHINRDSHRKNNNEFVFAISKNGKDIDEFRSYKCKSWDFDYAREENQMENIRICPHCGKTVIKSELPEYVWQCMDCDEDFYDFECVPKSDCLLPTDRLKKCCGEDPIFHKFSSLKCYAIECRVNGHIHNTGFADTESEAIEIWNNR